MKRRPSPSPTSTSPRLSRSPMGTRATNRCSPRSPENHLPRTSIKEENTADCSGSARRSRRLEKKVDYNESQHDDCRFDQTNGTASESETPLRRTRSSDANSQQRHRRTSSPFTRNGITSKSNSSRQNGTLSHSEDEMTFKSLRSRRDVHFSPSAKKSSPLKWERSRRRAADVARERLQSTRFEEDYNRRRASRSARRHLDESEEERTARYSVSHSLRRRTRSHNDDREADHESFSETEGETERRVTKRGSCRKLRRQDYFDYGKSEKEQRRSERAAASKEQEEEEHNDSIVRRSSRISSKRAQVTEPSDDDSSSEETSSDEEQTTLIGRSGRPKRNRHPVNRLTYSCESASRTKRRRLDSSSDDNRRRPTRSRRRSNRSRPRPIITRDDSSSSASAVTSDDEFGNRRKNVRMMLEMAKMRPMNMTKADMKKAVFRDRKNVGSSCADISPMDVDLSTSFESVGGSAEHIKCLKEIVVLPLLYPEIFSKFNITPPRGVLFHGPPGTGKTLLARALAAECSHECRKVSFFMRKGADCLNKWIGESERQLRLLFEQAYIMRPSIIFFDEIDGLAPVRSSRQDQIHSSIVSTLLALIDGLDSRGEVIVIGATNRIDNIDPALRRPGRFDRELRFELPSRDARKEILQVHTKTWKPKVPERLLDILADKTIGYSGADLKGLCAEAVLRALRRRYPQVYKTNQKLGLDTEQVVVIEEDFTEAMTTMVPSTHRVYDQHQAPLPTHIKPLLHDTVSQICSLVDSKHHHKFSFRPRVLIRGSPGQAVTTYIGPAILHHLEKLPHHVLDLPALYSNSARSPEEKLCHIMHEAKRTVPSVLYIPDLSELCMTEALRGAFLSLLAGIQTTAPLLVLAVAEKNSVSLHLRDEMESLIEKLFSNDEIFDVQKPTAEQRSHFFDHVFEVAQEQPVKPVEPEAVEMEELPIVPISEFRQLTEAEEKRLKKKEGAILRELRIFLREILGKLSRLGKFSYFRHPVDTECYDDYLKEIKNPMDFETMAKKLNDGKYNCAKSFLEDIDLIVDNALKYNHETSIGENGKICNNAYDLRDTAYAYIKAEMDTDFEDECQEIVQRRKKLTEKLNSEPELKTFDPNKQAGDDTNKPSAKKRPAKKKSAWARGQLPSRAKRPHVENGISDKSMNGVSCDDTKESVVNEPSDEEETKSEHSVEGTLILDAKKLMAVKSDLNKISSSWSVEKLEKCYIKMMEVVHRFRDRWDRRNLPAELRQAVDSCSLQA